MPPFLFIVCFQSPQRTFHAKLERVSFRKSRPFCSRRNHFVHLRVFLRLKCYMLWHFTKTLFTGAGDWTLIIMIATLLKRISTSIYRTLFLECSVFSFIWLLSMFSKLSSVCFNHQSRLFFCLFHKIYTALNDMQL